MVWLIATVAFFFTIERARGDDSSCWEYKDDCDYRISDGRGLTGFRSSYKGGMSRTGLTTRGENPSFTLGLCEGDCDHDNQCEDGLKCFQRNNYVTVPGCGDGGTHDYDYCYDPHGDRVVEFFDSEDLGGLANNEEEQEGWTDYQETWEFRWNNENPPRYFTGWSQNGVMIKMIENIVFVLEQLLMVGQLRIAHGATRMIFLIVIPKIYKLQQINMRLGSGQKSKRRIWGLIIMIVNSLSISANLFRRRRRVLISPIW